MRLFSKTTGTEAAKITTVTKGEIEKSVPNLSYPTVAVMIFITYINRYDRKMTKLISFILAAYHRLVHLPIARELVYMQQHVIQTDNNSQPNHRYQFLRTY